MIKSAVKTFFKSEISIGISLFIATLLALIVANSSNYEIYQEFFAANFPINLSFIDFYKNLTIRDWINDFLMALFFLLIGLELKKEILIGELANKNKIALPIIAALGGVIFPTLIFVFINWDNEQNLRGFAIPTATDIAFAYGVIALFGKKISNSLKVFLVTLAVIDDLIAILIIAFFYSQNLNLTYLALAFLMLFGLAFLNFKNCTKIWLYLVLGIFLWLLILKSGIHPTIAGVALGVIIPLRAKNQSPLSKLAHKIAAPVNFLILPLFAFANAAVKIEKFSIETFLQPLALGIILGLFLGKQAGVMLFGFLAVKLKIAHLPRHTNWLQFWGAAILTGIGFTMSLFIGSLAFLENDLAFTQVKIAVLVASFLSAILGIMVSYLATTKST